MEVHNQDKSQLAKLLATENITVRYSAQAKTAWFDVKNRVLMLPVWREMSNDLKDMLVVHEVGHALDTPPDGWLEAIDDIAKRVMGSVSSRATSAVKGFLNVIEDARIDKRQKRRFPGARRNYVKGYQDLIERDFFGTKSKDVNSMIFIDRLNIYCKGGSMLGIKFTPEEKQLLAKVEAAETFEEVLALTEEIFRWSKEHQQDTPEVEQGDDFRMRSADDDGDEYDDSEYDDENEFEDEEDMPSSKSKSKSQAEDDEAEDGEDEDFGDGDGDKEKQEKSDDPVNLGAKSNEQDEEYIPEAETEKAWQERQKELILDSDDEYIYVKIPRPVNYDSVVHDYKIVLADQRECIGSYHNKDWLAAVRTELQKFKSDEKASISFMVKEFEMRKSADEYMRTSISKTGVIDTNKLHSYKYNDDLFRRITTVATGKNHGFVMFIDWSGSMSQYLKKTVKQLISLTMFCKQVQIPFEVYSFRSQTSYDSNKGRYIGRMFTTNENDLDFDNFVARNLLSSRMNATEFNDAMFHLYLLGCGGHLFCDELMSTPLNECIGVADLIINRFKARSKVQIVNTIFLTDGQSDPISNVHGLRPSYTKKRHFILQDEITRKSYDMRITSQMEADDRSAYWNKREPYAYNKVMTVLLLKVLKDRVGGNLLGFYITPSGFASNYNQFNGQSGEIYVKSHNDWKTNGFFGVTTAGYDEYYILDAKRLDVSNGKLHINSDMTKRKIASEFIKFSEKKAVSRVLLTRFVKRIAA